MVFTNGFMLGIANGGTCLATCAPVLVPYLLGEGRTPRANVVSLGGFLGGRLVGYMLFAVLAWLTHSLLFEDLPHQRGVFGAATIVLALVMIVYGFAGGDHTCRGTALCGIRARLLRARPFWVPVGLGLLTGVNVCPPFLLALVSSARLSELGQSLLFFAGFFVGTSVCLAPLPVVGLAGRRERIKTIGRLATGVVGLFYLYSGVVSLIAEWH